MRLTLREVIHCHDNRVTKKTLRQPFIQSNPGNQRLVAGVEPHMHLRQNLARVLALADDGIRTGWRMTQLRMPSSDS